MSSRNRCTMRWISSRPWYRHRHAHRRRQRWLPGTVRRPAVAGLRLPRVKSISASGHKFGWFSPGCGWVIWRDEEALPQELVFNVDYPGGQIGTFAINFSRPAGQEH